MCIGPGERPHCRTARSSEDVSAVPCILSSLMDNSGKAREPSAICTRK